jgi:hypothetical protein
MVFCIDSNLGLVQRTVFGAAGHARKIVSPASMMGPIRLTWRFTVHLFRRVCAQL